LVLVILAVMWVLVLVPPLLRSRTDGRPSNSISSFQRQLRTLQRTGGYPSRGSVTYLRGPAQARRPAQPGPSARYDEDDWYDDHRGYQPARGAYPRPQAGRSQAPRVQPMRTPGAMAAQRELVRRRRQNILFTLVGTAFLSSVLGFGMGVSVMVWVCVGSLVALALYVLLLVQTRRAAELRAYRSSWSRIAA
jgi:hypothetical protein